MNVLKQERDSFNIVDQFAKYALVDRKINKLLDEIQTHTNHVRSNRLKSLMYAKSINSVIIVLLSIGLIYNNYEKPVIDFSSISLVLIHNKMI